MDSTQVRSHIQVEVLFMFAKKKQRLTDAQSSMFNSETLHTFEHFRSPENVQGRLTLHNEIAPYQTYHDESHW
jgi:hypothetical protein